MKTVLTFISVLCFLLNGALNLSAQTVGDYRSIASGPWNSYSTWEWYNGTEWTAELELPSSSSNIITIQSGDIVAISSNVTADQIIVNNGGVLQINTGSGLTVNDGSGDDLTVDGTLTISGSLGGSGKVIINGTCNWDYSYYDNIWLSNTNFNISSTGTFNLNGTSAKHMGGSKIYNSGTINHTLNSGEIRGFNNAVLENLSNGVFNAQFDGNLNSEISIYWSSGFTFNNAGTFKKTAGSGTYTMSRMNFNNTGTVLIESGKLDLKCWSNNPGHSGAFTLSSGTYLIFTGYYNTGIYLEENALIDGVGTVQLVSNSLQTNGTTNGAIFGSGTTFEFSGGTLDGGNSKVVTINGTMNWTGGTIKAKLTIADGAQMNISGSNGKTINAGKIYNSGTITHSSGAGNVHGYNSSVIENLSCGIFDVQNDASLYSTYNSGFWDSGFRINNAGMFKKTAGSGSYTLDKFTFDNTGTIQIDVGTIDITANGATLSSFSSNTLNSGTYNIKGTLKFKNASILTNNATIILDDASAQIVNESDVNALASFATNGATGSFTLRRGRNFSTSASTFTNNGILDCGNNIFSGSGNFTNASGSTLIIGSPDGITSSGANGNIQSSGTRTFHTAANYTYNGTEAQVTGNGLPSQVNNFTINNISGITLNSSVVTEGVLYLTSGYINTGSNTLTLGTGASSLGTLSRTAGTIIGNFKRWLAASTISDLLFPVGTATNYRPASVSFTSAPTGGTITAFFTASSPGANGLPLDDGGISITNVGSDGYWTLQSGDGLSGGTYNLDLTADGFSGVSDYSKLHLIKRENNGSNWTADGTYCACTGSNDTPILHRMNLTNFSQFGVGSTSDNPLPVEITSFTAVALDEGILLNWQTATEVNNYGFEIERQEQLHSPLPGGELKGWVLLSFVPGNGNSNSPNEYSFIDTDYGKDKDNDKDGVIKYRLKQIDTDGNYEYYGTITEVDFNITGIQEHKELAKEYSLSQNYPNPFNPSTTICYTIPDVNRNSVSKENNSRFGESHYNTTLKIYDMLGREVVTLVNEQKEPGCYEVQFDGSRLTSGIYLYKLQAGSYSSTKKLMLLK